MLRNSRRVVLLLVFFFILPCTPKRIISASLEVIGIQLDVANTLEFKDHFRSALSSVAGIPYHMINVGTAEPARSTRQVLSLQSRLLLEKTLRIPYTVSLLAIDDDEILTTNSPLYNLHMHDNDEEALKVQTYLSSANIREQVKTRLGVLLQIPTNPLPVPKSSIDVGNAALVDRMQQLRQQQQQQERVLKDAQIHLMATPANTPTGQPTDQPSNQPTMEPTEQPSSQPSAQPNMRPSDQPSEQPSSQPSKQPVMRPSGQPSEQPSSQPSAQPNMRPSDQPSEQPSSQPSKQPVMRPSGQPSEQPSEQPTMMPSQQPSSQPSCQPSRKPSSQPSQQPSEQPTMMPSQQPSSQPSAQPVMRPSGQPSMQPSCQPSTLPTEQPSCSPTQQPSTQPSLEPSSQPSNKPTQLPSAQPTHQPTHQPTREPSRQPTGQPSRQPSMQPTTEPTSNPSFVAASWGEILGNDLHRKRHRNTGICHNSCSQHGVCQTNANCVCSLSAQGDPLWYGADCSLRACPHDIAWVGHVVNANDLHPRMECSNKGLCDRKTGLCTCFPGYDGVACQRTACPSNCYGRGVCLTLRHFAKKAGRIYDHAWDANKQVGCLCDLGYRGPSCEYRECPSGPDPIGGYGNEAGRDCSGRGVCDYESGECRCFAGFGGEECSIIIQYS